MKKIIAIKLGKKLLKLKFFTADFLFSFFFLLYSWHHIYSLAIEKSLLYYVLSDGMSVVVVYFFLNTTQSILCVL